MVKIICEIRVVCDYSLQIHNVCEIHLSPPPGLGQIISPFGIALFGEILLSEIRDA